MSASLQGLDKATANAALALAALALNGGDVETSQEHVEQPSRRILDQARAELGISADDQSPSAIRRMRAHLAAEVQRRLFEGVDRAGLRDKLGDEGKLPVGAYKIVVGDNFKTTQKSENLRTAERIIRKANYVEHILGPDSKQADSKVKQVSLFLTRIESKNKKKEYWAIASALRFHDRLSVDAIYRLFVETVGDRPYDSPTDALADFLRIYGETFTISGRSYEGLARDIDLFGKPLALTMPEKDRRHVTLNAVISDNGVKLAYCIDMAKYNRDAAKFA